MQKELKHSKKKIEHAQERGISAFSKDSQYGVAL